VKSLLSNNVRKAQGNGFKILKGAKYLSLFYYLICSASF
jgi:hypothetical protein